MYFTLYLQWHVMFRTWASPWRHCASTLVHPYHNEEQTHAKLWSLQIMYVGILTFLVSCLTLRMFALNVSFYYTSCWVWEYLTIGPIKCRIRLIPKFLRLKLQCYCSARFTISRIVQSTRLVNVMLWHRRPENAELAALQLVTNKITCGRF